jgi:diguanylate cyclase (GGDEF)-like protein
VDLFLYQLNISGLTISAIVIALFFVVLWRWIPRAEMRWWTYGWIANVGALGVTSAFWYWQPPTALHGLVFGVYMFPKTLYAWLLLRGGLEFASIRPHRLRPSFVLPPVVALCAASIFVLTTRDRLGLATSVVIMVATGAAAIVLARARTAAARWVAMGFGVKAVHSAMEAAAYAVNLASTGQREEAMFTVPANVILAAHYSIGIGVEWLLAMGCVIGVTARMQSELQLANTQILEAQAGLRRLADRDPLTALANRRALPEVLRAVQPHGALLIFFDLDGFKKINDEHGHEAGDHCLMFFAAVLSQSFRPTDAVVRYGGDEFLVIASGLDESAVSARIEAVRTRASSGELPIRFSCGIGHLAVGGSPDEAIRAADEAMYRAKSGRRAPSRA